MPELPPKLIGTNVYEHEGEKFLEIIHYRHNTLWQVATAHEKVGHKTWLNPWDQTNWMLTIRLTTKGD